MRSQRMFTWPNTNRGTQRRMRWGLGGWGAGGLGAVAPPPPEIFTSGYIRAKTCIRTKPLDIRASKEKYSRKRPHLPPPPAPLPL